MTKRMAAHAAGTVLLLATAALAACGQPDRSTFNSGPGGADGGSETGGSTPADGGSFVGNGDGGSFAGDGAGSDTGAGATTCQTLSRPCSSACTDLPGAPVIDTGAPA